MSLKHVLEKINEITNVSGRKDKENLIKKFVVDPDFQEVVFFALHPFKKYNTTRVEYISDSNPTSVYDIFKYLNFLSSKTGTTDEEILELSKLSSFDKETVEVVRRIINKDLDCGASLKTFKKFIPNLPEYELMRCYKDLDFFFKKCDNKLENIFWSVKIDGVRTSTTGHGIYLSRNGKEFTNFNIFDEEIKQLKNTLNELYPDIKWDNVIIDGEGVIDCDDNADFQKLMTQVKRLKDVDSSMFKYYIFDIVLDDVSFENRFEMLKNAFEKNKFNYIILLNHQICNNFNSLDDIKEFANKVIEEGHEGLVLKDKRSLYERKKSRFWCKVKQVHTYDVKVTSWEYGRKKYSNVIGNFNCQFANGVTFEVGSGLTDSEREEFMENTPEIIEIEYQELTKDGKPRFPVFKRVREDKSDID